MHSVLWASIFASTGVAAVTTLIVEYLAKPSLEVRKERILEIDRQYRTATHNLKRSSFLAGSLLSCRTDKEMPKPLVERMYSMAAEIEQILTNAYEVIEVPVSITEEWSGAAVATISFSVFFRSAWPPEVAWDTFETASGQLEIFARLISTPSLYICRRRALIREIKFLASSASTSADA